MGESDLPLKKTVLKVSFVTLSAADFLYVKDLKNMGATI